MRVRSLEIEICNTTNYKFTIIKCEISFNWKTVPLASSLLSLHILQSWITISPTIHQQPPPRNIQKYFFKTIVLNILALSDFPRNFPSALVFTAVQLFGSATVASIVATAVCTRGTVRVTALLLVIGAYISANSNISFIPQIIPHFPPSLWTPRGYTGH